MTTAPAGTAVSSTTPILDRLTPPPALQLHSKTHKSTIIVLLAVIFVTVIWIVSMIWVPGVWGFFYPFTQRLQTFLDKTLENTFSGHLQESLALWRFWAPWLAIFPAIAVHELGHTFACVIVSFRVLAVRVGRLQISPPFHIKWGQHSLPGASGFTVFVPNHSHRLRGRALAVLFAGPLANLVSAVAVVFLTTPTLFTVSFVALSIALGLGNLIPFRRKAVLSDGKRILMLLRNSQQGERWLALLQLRADMRNGVRTEKLSPEFIALATAVEDDSPETVIGHTIAFSAAFEKHDDPEAARLLEICLRHSGCVGPRLREAAFLNAAIFQAERRKRADLAEQWLAELPAKSLFPRSRLNAQGAILQSQGDIPGALKKLDESEAMVLRLPPSPRREASLRSLQKWRAELQAMQSPVPVETT